MAKFTLEYACSCSQVLSGCSGMQDTVKDSLTEANHDMVPQVTPTPRASLIQFSTPHTLSKSRLPANGNAARTIFGIGW